MATSRGVDVLVHVEKETRIVTSMRWVGDLLVGDPLQRSDWFIGMFGNKLQALDCPPHQSSRKHSRTRSQEVRLTELSHPQLGLR